MESLQKDLSKLSPETQKFGAQLSVAMMKTGAEFLQGMLDHAKPGHAKK